MIFFNSQKLIEQIIRDIDESQISIDIEVYIWDSDEVGRLFEEALIRAHKRGVRVRIIVDRIGSLEWIATHVHRLISQGLDIRVFRPLPGIGTFLKYYPNRFIPLMRAINRRDHRKVFIMDKKTAYVGSFNIYEFATKWKETTVRFQDEKEISILEELFNCTWDWIEDDTARFRECDFSKVINDVEGSLQIRTTQTRRLRRHYCHDFLSRIEKAKKKIWLVTPYFNPPRFILKSLVAAAQRDVDVRLMVPMVTDPLWFSYLSRLYYSPLVKKGLRVFNYQKGFLHSKTAIIDDEGIVGSGNLNYRSFYQDLELNIMISNPEDIQAMEEEFLKDIRFSQEIRKPQDMSLWARAFGSFLMLFKTSF